MPQLHFLAAPEREKLYGGAAGGGKAGRVPNRAAPSYNEDMETKVLTPKGFKLLGDVEVGDRVCNPDGTVARVVAVHDRGMRQFYRLTLADGSSVESDGEHLWAMSIAGTRKRRKQDVPRLDAALRREDDWNLRLMQRHTVVNTKQLKELVERADTEQAAGSRPRYVQLPLTAPVNLTAPKGRWPVIPPYTLGVLVGDGHLGERAISFTSADGKVAGRIEAELGDRLLIKSHEKSDNRARTYKVVGRVGQKSESPQQLLRRDGLLGLHSWDKFVPERIKLAPEQTRLAFVQGLMDADGYMDSRGHVQFTTVSERLASDMQWLLRSLGCRATLTSKEGSYRKDGERRQGRTAYMLYVQGADLDRLFGLERKAEKVRPFNGGEVLPSHRVVSVEPTEHDYARCITVDHPNGLYVTDDFIVTHNSSALLMDALLGVELPEYAAILFRRTFPDLALPGAIMDRSKEWLMGTDAKWNENEKTWTFPSGATLSFGYLEHEKHKYRYQGAEFQYIGFDELTQFPYSQYSYLRSRLRKTVESPVAVRMGNATNPGGVGHDWVYQEFVKGVNDERVFIPALLDDNPHLDQAEYEKSLEALDEITREQLLKGRWVRDETGHPFKRTFFANNRFHIEQAVSGHVLGRWISWDTALKDTEGSAYNVAVVVELLTDYRLRVREVVRFKATFPELVPQIESLAQRWSYDGLLRGVVIEDKASGTSAYQTLASAAPAWLSSVLALFQPGSYSKLSRWSQAALWCQRECVLLPHPSDSVPWLYDFESELHAVPDAEYKDAADAFSQIVIYLEHLLSEGYRARAA